MYFGELNRHYREYAWFWYLQGAFGVVTGLILLFFPATILILLLLVSLWFILRGSWNILAILRGKIVPHLVKIVLASGVLQLAIGLLILLEPLALVIEVIGDLAGVLFLFRGVLSLMTFIQSDSTVVYRRTILLETILSLTVGFMLIAFTIFGSILAIEYIALVLIFEGVAHIRDAWLLSEQFDTIEEFTDTILQQHTLPASNLKAATAEVSAVTISSEKRIEKPEFIAHKRMRRGWRVLAADKYKRPLFVTPHPDDLEGFASGLAYACDAPSISVIVAGGNLGVWEEEFEAMPRREYVSVRLQESEVAARMLGIQEIVYLGYLDREVVPDEVGVQRILSILEKYQPDVAVSFEFYKRLTPYPHPDHIGAAQMVRNAVARYTGEVDYFVTSTLAPTHFLDVSGSRRVKLEALACHTTQADLNRIIFPLFERTITKLWGTFTGVRFAEGYRHIPKADLLKNLSRQNPLMVPKK